MRTASESEPNSSEAKKESKLSLPEAVKQYEAQLIKEALEANGNSVTHAAHALGISHQGLSAILQNRHRGLLQREKPRKRRRQHIIIHDKGRKVKEKTRKLK